MDLLKKNQFLNIRDQGKIENLDMDPDIKKFVELLNLKNKENLSEEDILNEIKNQDRMFMMKEKVLRDYKKQTKQQLESI